MKVVYPPFPLRGQNCMCSACACLFRTVSTFDRHRYGPWEDRRCLTKEELTEKGWTQDLKGFWRRPSRFAKGQVLEESI